MRKLLVYSLIGIAFSGLAFAQVGRRGDFGDDPSNILDNVAGEVNEDTGIQDTQLNRVSRQEGGYATRFTITNTLDSIRIRLAPYLQWIVYIGLALAVIFIIYNGFLMVTGSLHGQGERSAVQKRIMMIITGVLLLTGFYFIIRLIVILANTIAS